MNVTGCDDYAIPGYTEYAGNEHDLQLERQGYLKHLKDQIVDKVKSLREEADAGAQSNQTFQRWMAE